MTSEASELARTTARLERQTARLEIYLRVRAVLGLGLLGFAALMVGIAGAYLASALGVLELPALARWTQGFDAVLAVFMPSAVAWMAGRTGTAWWRHRRIDDVEPGCPTC